jgi:hypothetical protein
LQVTIHAAKTHLSKLIEAALNGEEVVISADTAFDGLAGISGWPSRVW